MKLSTMVLSALVTICSTMTLTAHADWRDRDHREWHPERTSYYDWTGSGSCAEYAPGGVYIRAVELEACRRAQPSHFDWTGSGSCAEYTPGGVYIMARELQDCRYARPSHFDWTGSGSCAEYTPSNVYIMARELNDCRRSVGSHYAWTGTGSCAEYTPSGVYIMAVSNDRCRYAMNEDFNGAVKGTVAASSDLSAAVAELESAKGVQATEAPGSSFDLSVSTAKAVN